MTTADAFNLYSISDESRAYADRKRSFRLKAKDTVAEFALPDDECRAWAKGIVQAARQCRERGDNDGRTGLDAHFYPTLSDLAIDKAKGEINFTITEAYND